MYPLSHLPRGFPPQLGGAPLHMYARHYDYTHVQQYALDIKMHRFLCMTDCTTRRMIESSTTILPP